MDETVVMWAGEFGRLPISQKGTGRDHNRFGFSLWMAGGGFKKGYIHGATDDIGYRAVENRVSVPELHATLFHRLGTRSQACHIQAPRPRREFDGSASHTRRGRSGSAWMKLLAAVLAANLFAGAGYG